MHVLVNEWTIKTCKLISNVIVLIAISIHPMAFNTNIKTPTLWTKRKQTSAKLNNKNHNNLHCISGQSKATGLPKIRRRIFWTSMKTGHSNIPSWYCFNISLYFLPLLSTRPTHKKFNDHQFLTLLLSCFLHPFLSSSRLDTTRHYICLPLRSLLDITR